eukprot:TRINITY_DN43860_c0_g1_i1.p1 TRINITY_DN43860_c0_g1~~TRINITY_DN43860_c0_g1_i1.p1  ORF type:complete len:345 (-),score=32.34 TRINITY_DN43860_c0_g1_i1:71-1066(-)
MAPSQVSAIPRPARYKPADRVWSAVSGLVLALGATSAVLPAFVTNFRPHEIGRTLLERCHATGRAGLYRITACVGASDEESQRPSKTPGAYRLEIGRAIDVLRTDVTGQFDHGRERPDYSIFSEDITFVDQRMPSMELHGLNTYKRTLRAVRWAVKAVANTSRMEITAMQQPVDNKLYVRWRLRILPKELLALAARGVFSSLMDDGTLVVEGCSKYEFHHTTAKITRHTLDITNPPLYLSNFLVTDVRSWELSVPTGMPTPGLLRFAMPSPCEDDFECNNGTANYPLQCLLPHECNPNLPRIFAMGRFCCEPDLPQPATELLRVPVPSQYP